jgi:hypothetical protein
LVALGLRGDDWPSTTKWNNDNQGIFAPPDQGAYCLQHRRVSETWSIEHQRGSNIKGFRTSKGIEHPKGTTPLDAAPKGVRNRRKSHLPESPNLPSRDLASCSLTPKRCERYSAGVMNRCSRRVSTWCCLTYATLRPGLRLTPPSDPLCSSSSARRARSDVFPEPLSPTTAILLCIDICKLTFERTNLSPCPQAADSSVMMGESGEHRSADTSGGGKLTISSLSLASASIRLGSLTLLRRFHGQACSCGDQAVEQKQITCVDDANDVMQKSRKERERERERERE